MRAFTTDERPEPILVEFTPRSELESAGLLDMSPEEQVGKSIAALGSRPGSDALARTADG